ncbi:MAG TPA: hypothetical protein DCP91_00505 [Eggerthellaceae bacterium]|nr:hypothetical protein [Eggerthellaceae bacterium]
MTSYTSVNENLHRNDAGPDCPSPVAIAPETAPNPLRTALVYLVCSLFCALFGAVYELFSHEVYSYYMIYAFAIPLTLGALPNLVIALRGKCAPGKLAANMWNSGVATLTVGCIMKGVLDIYGTTNQLALAYPIAAAALLVAGVVLYWRCPSLERRTVGEAPQRPMSASLPSSIEWTDANGAL